MAFAAHLIWQYYAFGALPHRRGGGTASIWELYIFAGLCLWTGYFAGRRFFDDRPVVGIDARGIFIRKRGEIIPWDAIERIERYPASENTLKLKRFFLVHLKWDQSRSEQPTVRVDWLGLDAELDEAMRTCERLAPGKTWSI